MADQAFDMGRDAGERGERIHQNPFRAGTPQYNSWERGFQMTHKEKSLDFMECEACSRLPGTPPLCRGCVHNRRVITELLNKLKEPYAVPTGGAADMLREIVEHASEYAEAPIGSYEIDSLEYVSSIDGYRITINKNGVEYTLTLSERN